jgi:hypothetical protein
LLGVSKSSAGGYNRAVPPWVASSQFTDPSVLSSRGTQFVAGRLMREPSRRAARRVVSAAVIGPRIDGSVPVREAVKSEYIARRGDRFWETSHRRLS